MTARRPFTPEEDARLRELAETCTAAQASKALRRARQSVRRRAAKLGVGFRISYRKLLAADAPEVAALLDSWHRNCRAVMDGSML